jgi:transcriptional regulator with XRE-family HTH domain
MTENYNESTGTPFTKILFDYMRAIEDQQHQRISISWFARHFGIKQGSLSNYLAGQTEPNEENLHKLAAKIGPAVYDALGKPRPVPNDPVLRYVVARWSRLTADEQEEIRRIVEGDDPRPAATRVEPNPDQT